MDPHIWFHDFSLIVSFIWYSVAAPGGQHCRFCEECLGQRKDEDNFYFNFKKIRTDIKDRQCWEEMSWTVSSVSLVHSLLLFPTPPPYTQTSANLHPRASTMVCSHVFLSVFSDLWLHRMQLCVGPGVEYRKRCKNAFYLHLMFWHL